MSILCVHNREVNDVTHHLVTWHPVYSIDQRLLLVMCNIVMNTTSCFGPQVLPLHAHWHNKEMAPPSVHSIIGVFITIVGLVAVVGNSLVVLTCIRFKELRTRSNLLILNLAIGDLLMCTIDFPLLALASFNNYWTFGKQVCHLYAFLTAVAGLVTINSLAAISADRYWAVVRRSSPGQQPPKCVMGVIVLAVWTYSVAWAACPLFGWGDYVLDGIRTTCTFDYLTRSWGNRSFVISMSISNFVLPFLVMIFSYTRIWVTIREIKSGLEKQASLVSVGSCTYAATKVPKFTSSSPSSGDDRYSKMNINIKSENGVPVNSVKRQLERRDIYSNYNEQSYHSLRCSKGRDDVVTFSMDSPTHNVTESCVKGTAFCNSQLKNPKQQKQWSDFQHWSDTIHRGTNECETHKITNDDLSFYNHHYKSFDYKRDPGGEPTNPADQRANISYKCGVFQNGNYPAISKVYIQDYYVTNHQNKSTNPITSKTIESQMDISHGPGGQKIFEKIRLRYRSAFKNGLFLKQHRYRLHCEQKTMKIIMCLLVAFIVSWCPYMVISLIGLFGDASRITYFTSVLPSLLAKTSMVFNPILYSISHPKVRKRILALFCKQLSSRQVNGLRLNHMRSSITCSNSKS